MNRRRFFASLLGAVASLALAQSIGIRPPRFSPDYIRLDRIETRYGVMWFMMHPMFDGFAYLPTKSV